LILGAILLASRTPCRAVDTVLESGDRDVTIRLDRTSIGLPARLALRLGAGDFNGDGRDDLAVASRNDAASFLDLIPGGDWPRDGLLTERSSLCFHLPLGSVDAPLPFFADVNGDGRDDLLVQASTGAVSLYWGRADVSGVIDAIGAPPDLRIRVPGLVTSFAAGDVDGDGRADVLFGWSVGHGRAYLLRGRDVFPAEVDVTDPAWATTFIGLDNGVFSGQFGASVALADVNGDGYADVVVSAPLVLSFKGEIDGFFGGPAPFPATWDLNVRPPSFRIQGGQAAAYSRLSAAADWSGDGRVDLLIALTPLESRLIDGSSLAEGTVRVVDATDADLPRISNSSLGEFHVLDFDGDGRTDLLNRGQGTQSRLRAYLSSSGTSFLTEDGGVRINHYSLTGAVGDFDGDGWSDVALGDYAVGATQGDPAQAAIFYGFRPLTEPAATFQSSGGARVRGTFAVNGEPAAMRIVGDVREPPSGLWVPFASERVLLLTGDAGAKEWRVTFRNRRGRESAGVTARWSVTSDGGLHVQRNRVAAGRSAAWDVSTGGGRFTAAVHTPSGGLVRRLADGDRGAGVWTLEWDGRNEAGESAAPGVYVLIVKTDDDVRRVKVLVDP
jgi:hypothetical protein